MFESRLTGEKTFRLMKLLREEPNLSFHKYAEKLNVGEDSVKVVVFKLWEMGILTAKEAKINTVKESYTL